jgi:hypothetical protein
MICLGKYSHLLFLFLYSCFFEFNKVLLEFENFHFQLLKFPYTASVHL